MRMKFDAIERLLMKAAEAFKTFGGWLHKMAIERRRARDQRRPVNARLIFAAVNRCPCGHGLAYDPVGESGKIAAGHWDCSAILLGIADQSVTHTAKLPFAFYEIKSEEQPSARGATTRSPIAGRGSASAKVET